MSTQENLYKKGKIKCEAENKYDEKRNRILRWENK